MAYSFGPGPITPAVRILLYANVITYVVSLAFPVVVDWFGLQPQLVLEKYRLWQPVTYMFIHARSPSHILFNMLILWMFGVELERVWRTPFFVKYYFVTGVGAGLLSIAVALLPFDATRATYYANIIGASGALYGLLLAYAIYYPNRPILMFLFFPVPAKYFACSSRCPPSTSSPSSALSHSSCRSRGAARSPPRRTWEGCSSAISSCRADAAG